MHTLYRNSIPLPNKVYALVYRWQLEEEEEKEEGDGEERKQKKAEMERNTVAATKINSILLDVLHPYTFFTRNDRLFTRIRVKFENCV